jgi:hypothetical protein
MSLSIKKNISDRRKSIGDTLSKRYNLSLSLSDKRRRNNGNVTVEKKSFDE